MSTPLRVGIIGLGARCSIVENCQVSSVPAELVGGCDPNSAMRERAREILGDHPWVESLEELLDLGIDAAIVTSPDDTHEDITCQLLEAGVGVYLEKPIAITIEGADRVLETAFRTKTPLYVGHNMRHMAVVRILRQVIRDGLIGEVRAIWCRHFVGNGGDYYFKDWHADRSRTTGLLLQKAAHDIDVMNWLSDSVPERVVGMGDLMVYGKLTDRSGQRRDSVMSDWFSLDNGPPESLTGLKPVIDVEDL
ncbi:Gfo/Idh/MocA family oxidoreductase, partial [uncultured Actinomyces sp.]|uniref:Gfo/Idh/MocA family protein n=1 Tax=uncultured Actinomyces sp. TaxID=249061 RepID=UPI0025DB4BBF